MRILFLAFLLIPAAAGDNHPAIEATTWEPRVGEPFPDLALPTLEGSVQSISDFRGQKLILHVFASW